MLCCWGRGCQDTVHELGRNFRCIPLHPHRNTTAVGARDPRGSILGSLVNVQAVRLWHCCTYILSFNAVAIGSPGCAPSIIPMQQWIGMICATSDL